MPVIDVITTHPARKEPPGAARKLGDQIFFTDDLLKRQPPNQNKELGTRSGFCTLVRMLAGFGTPVAISAVMNDRSHGSVRVPDNVRDHK